MRTTRISISALTIVLALAGCSSSDPTLPGVSNAAGAVGTGGSGVGGTASAGKGGASGTGGASSGTSGTAGTGAGATGGTSATGGSSGKGGSGAMGGTSGSSSSSGGSSGSGQAGSNSAGTGGSGTSGSAGSAGSSTCGHPTEPCCTAGTACLGAGYACGAGMTCDPCGSSGGPCCGTTCNANLTCSMAGTCACGDKDEPCCGGAMCNGGLTCDPQKKMCACGGEGQACCPGTPPTCTSSADACAGFACTCVNTVEGVTGVGELVVTNAGTLWNAGNVALVTNLDGTTFSGATSVEVGGIWSGTPEFFACARTGDNGGTAYCWNLTGTDNSHGQLGNGTTMGSYYPFPVVQSQGGPALTGVVSVAVAQVYPGIATGGFTACAIVAGGGVMCWGEGAQGQLGNGLKNSSSFPVSVELAAGTPLTGMDQIALGETHACAHGADGTVWCWGANDSGQLGDGTTQESLYASQVTMLGNSAVNVRAFPADIAKTGTTCAVTNDGSAYCWGENASGQIGDGTTSPAHAPVKIMMDNTGAAFGNVADMQAYEAGACAVKTDGSLWCWGGVAGGIGKPVAHTAQNMLVLDVHRLGHSRLSYVRKDGSVWANDTKVLGFACP